MQIVIDLTSLDDNFSGIERYALNISKNLIIQDKFNEYILLFKNKIHTEFIELKNLDNTTFKVIKGKNKLIFNQIILPRFLYSIEADKYLFLAFPSPILFRRKGIINAIHDLTPWDYPETMKILSKLYFKFGIINAIRISDEIVTVSQFSQKRIFEKFGYKNTHVIYNGISDVFIKSESEVPIIKSEIREKYNLPSKYIMCLCTLEPRKNIQLLIRAHNELLNDNKIDSKLVLVGRKGWKIDEFLKNINIKQNDNIIITGFVDDKDLPEIYKGADMFVFPSLYEGFGIPVIEAMYMNVPIICSNSSSLPEVIGDTGILFNNNDLNDLKNKILLLKNMDKNKRQLLIKNAKQKAMNFNWNNEAIKLKNIINSID